MIIYTSADILKAHDYIITNSAFNVDSLNNMEAFNIIIVRDNLASFKIELNNIIKYFNNPETKKSEYFGQSIHLKCGLKYEYSLLCKYDPHGKDRIIIKPDKNNTLWDERPGKTHKENYGMMNEGCHNCVLCGNNFTNKSGICPILILNLSNGLILSLESEEDGDYVCWDVVSTQIRGYHSTGILCKIIQWLDKLISFCDNVLIIKKSADE